MRGKRAWVFSALFVLTCGVFLEFLPETFAVAWHVKHGRTAVLGDYRIPVPTLWFATHDDGSFNTMLFGVPGRLRAVHLGKNNLSTVLLSVGSSGTTGIEQQKLLPVLDSRLGTTTTTVARLSIAGQQTICFKNDVPTFPDMIQIRCVPETQTRGMSALYSGNSQLADRFFDILREVKKK